MARDFDLGLEELSEIEREILLDDFSGGVGTLRRRRGQSDLRSLFGYAYAVGVDSWNGSLAPALLSTADTPTGISALKTDYASMLEVFLNNAWYVVLVKGTKSWATTGTAFSAATDTVTGAQGRQLVYGYVTGTNDYILVWLCGSGATARYTTNPTGTWTAIGSTPITMVCGWFAYAGSTDQQTLFAIRVGGGTLTHHIYGITTLGSPWSDTGMAVPPAISGGIGVIPLGSLTDNGTVFLANGPRIWEVAHTSKSAVSVAHQHWTGFQEITAGCRLEDRFAITDGSPEIYLWHPTQRRIKVSLFPEGVPDAIRGSVKALQTVGEYLICFWEMDNAAPVVAANRGNTLIFWSKPNLQGQTTWHCRACKYDAGPPETRGLLGGFPLSIGSPMVLAEKTVANKRRFWVCTADTTNGRAYYQDHPLAGFNPLLDTGAIYQYEDGPLSLYTARKPLILAGDQAGTMINADCDGDLSETETLQLRYRSGGDTLGEEDANAAWSDPVTFDSDRRRGTFAGRAGVQADEIQVALDLDRGGTVTAKPVVRGVSILARRAERAPSEKAI